MDVRHTFLSLGVALVAGLVIGFEREQSHAQHHPQRPLLGGARTHPLFALIGALAALLSARHGVFAILAALACLLALTLASYLADVRQGERGLTSEAALLLSFLLGVLSGTTGLIEPIGDRMLLVLAISVVATLLLSMKVPLHRFIHKVSVEDIFATLKFLLVAVVVLPLLPDQTYGPLDVLNPRKIGFMAVLIAGLSFVGYVLIRLLGPHRGLGLTGLVGGLASSTAVTLTFSGRARETPALADSCALAVVAASSIMFARVLVVVAVVNGTLVRLLAVPLLVMALIGAGSSFVLYRRSRAARREGGDVQIRNPFELSSALKFAALYAAVLWVAKAVTTSFGTGAIYATGLLAGATDVDAITLSMANLALGALDPKVAVTTILLATASNTLVKGAMAVTVGGWAYGRRVVAAFAAMIAGGGVALATVWLA